MSKRMLKELCDLYPTSWEPKANNKITIQKEKEKKEKESKTKTSRKVAKTIKDCTPQEESKKLYFGNNPVGPKDECIYLFKEMKRT